MIRMGRRLQMWSGESLWLVSDKEEAVSWHESSLFFDLKSDSRDDCRDSLYCDPTTYRCFNEKQVGESCNADTECLEVSLRRCQLHTLPILTPSPLFLLSFSSTIATKMESVIRLLKLPTRFQAGLSDSLELLSPWFSSPSSQFSTSFISITEQFDLMRSIGTFQNSGLTDKVS